MPGGRMNPISAPSFISQLDASELVYLRAAIRAMHRDSFPGHAPLSVDECDFVIEKIGSEVVRDMIGKRRCPA